MGFGFPTGMQLSMIDKRPTPWFWGINGAAGVLAASIAVLTSIEFGIDTTLRVAAICYFLLPGPALPLVGSARAAKASASASAEKWTRFSAPNDAPLQRKSIGWIPKVESTFPHRTMRRFKTKSILGVIQVTAPDPQGDRSSLALKRHSTPSSRLGWTPS